MFFSATKKKHFWQKHFSVAVFNIFLQRILDFCWKLLLQLWVSTSVLNFCCFSFGFPLMCVTMLNLQLTDACVLQRYISFCNVYIDREYI